MKNNWADTFSPIIFYTQKEGFKKYLKKYIYEFSFQTPYVCVNKTDLFFALYE